jgi:tRNA dimethylallyltransferase
MKIWAISAKRVKKDSKTSMTTTKSSEPRIPVICGPTAAGKTAVGVLLAQHFNAEIISADSRQFYHEMSIGTAKPTEEEMCGIPHHFVDSHSIEKPLTAGEFERQGEKKIQEMLTRGKLPIVVGGSGLFIRSLIEGLDDLPSNEKLRQALIEQYNQEGLNSLLARLKKVDPKAESQIDAKNQVRVMRAIELVELSGKPLAAIRNQEKRKKPFQPVWIGISPEREILYERINRRVDEMLKSGLVEEAKRLLEFNDSAPLKTVGYQELFDHFDGNYDYDEAVRLIKRNTRHFAKRQLTWFRKIDGIEWSSPFQIEAIIAHIESRIG